MCAWIYEIVQNPTQYACSLPLDWESLSCLKLSSYFLNRKVVQVCFLNLLRLSSYPSKILGTLWIQSPASVELCVLQSQFFSVPGHPTSRTCRAGSTKSQGARLLLSAKIFKPPHKRFGSYKFHQDLPSRGLCWVPHSGSSPRWVPSSRASRNWRILSARKGSWAVCHPSHMPPPMDLVTTREAPESLKIKLPNETIFNMSIFSQGNTEE